VHRVRVRRRHHVGPGRVDLRMDGEPGLVDGLIPDHDLAGRIDQLQVGHTNPAERHRERVDPEVIGQLGVSGGDVPGGTQVEAELGEDPERAGQLLLAMQPLGRRIRRRRVGLEALLVNAQRLAPELAGDTGLATRGDAAHESLR
jgi:hypothetical protein